MINFDAVDFSERRLEEVISFFWRSVYDLIQLNNSHDVTSSRTWRTYLQNPVASATLIHSSHTFALWRTHMYM